MIEYQQGNLLETKADALVNTVNCVGIMGKGIALQFKQAFPENFKKYERACKNNEVQIGKMFVVETGNLFPPKYLINFPTKNHWKGKSKIADIKFGLDALVNEVQRLGITSIAIPPLGCGNGGLNWLEVKPLLESAFTQLPNVQVIIFEPSVMPVTANIAVTSKTPNMTRARALFIRLLELYGIQGYELTKLEIQKLAYFLQEAGEPLKLAYEKHLFGPYANNLNHVLKHIEGHFIRGYGDGSGKGEIYVLPTGRESANNFLQNHPEADIRLEKVGSLINGFETPYGLEMLATVHWVATKYENPAQNSEQAVNLFHAWNPRKKQIFKTEHIHTAWHHLKSQNWI